MASYLLVLVWYFLFTKDGDNVITINITIKIFSFGVPYLGLKCRYCMNYVFSIGRNATFIHGATCNFLYYRIWGIERKYLQKHLCDCVWKCSAWNFISRSKKFKILGKDIDFIFLNCNVLTRNFDIMSHKTPFSFIFFLYQFNHFRIYFFEIWALKK